MLLFSPREIGTPAPETVDPKERFVNAVVALHQARLKRISSRIVSLATSDSLPDPQLAYETLMSGHMPRQAGFVRLGRGVIGALDLQAAKIHGNKLVLYPQLKQEVDPDTKEIRAAGIVTFSRINPTTGVVLSVRPYAEAVNPDLYPWQADALGIKENSHQNDHGFVIAPIDMLAFPLYTRQSNIDPINGQLTLQTKR